MNRIFTVIWSEARHCYMAVSEMARRHTKGTGGKRTRQAVLAAVLGGALLLPVSSAWAWTGGYNASGGTIKSAYYVYRWTAADGTIRLQSGRVSTNSSNGENYGNVALGNYANAGGGNGNTKYISHSHYQQFIVNPDGGMSYSPEYPDSVWDAETDNWVYGKYVVGSDKYGDYISDAEGNYYEVTGFPDPNIPGDTYKAYKLDEDFNHIGGEITIAPKDMPRIATNATAVGNAAQALADSSTAVGERAQAQGYKSIAMGSEAQTGDLTDDADYNDGISAAAFGDTAKAIANSSVAIGDHAQSYGYAGVAVGRQAHADTTNSVAIGIGATVDYDGDAASDETKLVAENGVAIGWNSAVRGKDGTATGRQAEANRRNASAYGNNSHANGYNSVAVGNKSIAGLQSQTGRDPLAGQSATAVGNRATAIAEYTTAVGPSTWAEGWHSVAVGDSNRATGRFSTAMGAGWSTYDVPGEDDNTNTEGPRNYSAIGANQASGDYSTSVGYGNATLGDNSSAFGMQNAVSGHNSLGVGSSNQIGEAREPGKTDLVGREKGSVTGFAFGNANKITGNLGLAAGESNEVTGENGMAVGVKSKAAGKRSMALGTGAESAGENSIAAGAGAKASAQGAMGIGAGADGSGLESIAVGAGAKASGRKSIAAGAGARALHARSVALGDGAVTDAPVGTSEVEIPGAGAKYSNVSGTKPVGTVSVGKPGEERTITNVAAGRVGPGSTDAINGSELYAVKQGMEQNYNDLSKKIGKVGAGSAAMAMLHPLDFNPDEKWSFAASTGHYRSENAVALGAFYRPNEDTMFSVGGTVGNGDNMVAASVSWKFGQKNHVSVNRVSTAKEILELRKALEDLRSLIADGVAGNGLDLTKLEIFPDVPENHWAYDYVATLAGNGILEGYPDGYFKGGRQMTRYEMAAVIYRAMMNGAKINAKALKEFGPELDRFRVDTITYHKDGTPHVQRVRTIETRK